MNVISVSNNRNSNCLKYYYDVGQRTQGLKKLILSTNIEFVYEYIKKKARVK